MYEFSSIASLPVKDVSEQIIIEATESRYILESLQGSFRRDYPYQNSVVIGHADNPKLIIKNFGRSQKISMKLQRENYDRLCAIAYALDVTPSTAAAALLVLGMRNYAFMSDYVTRFLNHLESTELKEIRRLMHV